MDSGRGHAAGVPDGYAGYTRTDGSLVIDETITGDDAVFTTLARFALDHDLVTEVVFKHFPTGHAVLAARGRRRRSAEQRDGLAVGAAAGRPAGAHLARLRRGRRAGAGGARPVPV